MTGDCSRPGVRPREDPLMAETVPPVVPPPAPASDTSQPAHQDQNWFGIVALVTGLIGMNLVAIVFGALGLRAVRAGRATNKGMALAGTILGALGLVAIAGVVAFVALSADNSAKAEQDQAALVDVQAIYQGVQGGVAVPDNETLGQFNDLYVRADGRNYVVDGIPIAPQTVKAGTSVEPHAGLYFETPSGGPVTCVALLYEGGAQSQVAYRPDTGPVVEGNCY